MEGLHFEENGRNSGDFVPQGTDLGSIDRKPYLDLDETIVLGEETPGGGD
jgi:hypothetical protein